VAIRTSENAIDACSAQVPSPRVRDLDCLLGGCERLIGLAEPELGSRDRREQHPAVGNC
jgi:hypothetical protein